MADPVTGKKDSTKNGDLAMTEMSQEKLTEDDGEKSLGAQWCFWRRRRYVLAVLAFLGFINLYTLRINLSVAIVAMTTPHHTRLENGTVVETAADFDWDSRIQGLLLSSFFYGYTASQLPGGWVALRVGGTKLFGMGIAGTALLTLLTPPLANISVYILIAIRIVEGLLEGLVMPSINHVWSRWAPPLERSRLATFAVSGCNVGTVLVLPISGLLASTVGWPSIFYVFGAIGLLWYIAWWIVIADSPELDPHISTCELNYIESSLGRQNCTEKVSHHPWRQIFTSVPYLAKVAAHFASNWGFYTLVTQLPLFMKDTLSFNIKEAGFVSAVPYLLMAILLQTAGHLADFLESRRIFSTTNVRKIFMCGAFILQATALLLSTYLTNITAVLVCVIAGVALAAFAYATLCVNSLDLAPAHASVLAGISSTVANLSGIISPQLTGFIVRNKSAEEWRIVFYITSALYLCGAVVFGLFASGDKQPWAEDGVVRSDIKVDSVPAKENDNRDQQV
ncbi:vesicular glutamate transporter 1 [Anabrus simplex]|uniref:vesicular glutamate transporter 1 n=1 Tax=Anabrus simplex TaxID=316456 RepID=UPI0035A27B51